MEITRTIFIDELDEWLEGIKPNVKEYQGCWVLIIDAEYKMLDMLRIEDIINM